MEDLRTTFFSDASALYFNSLNLDEVIERVMVKLRELIGVTRLDIFELMEGGETLINSYSWADQKPALGFKKFEVFPVSAVLNLIERLRRNENITIPGSPDIPTSSLGQIRNPAIVSSLLLPFFLQGKFSGFLCYGRTGTHDKHSSDEVAILKWISSMVGLIIEHQHTVRALTESEDRYCAIYRNSIVGIGISTVDDIVVEANNEMAHIFKSTPEEMVGLNLRDIYVEPRRRRMFHEALAKQDTAQNYEIELYNLKGEKFWALLNVHRALYKGQICYFTILQDITERKRAEEKIKVLSEGLDGTVNAIIMTDLRGTITYVNQSTERIFGYSKDGLIGQNIEIFNYSKQENLLRAIAESLRTEASWKSELIAKRKNGQPLVISFSCTLIKNKAGLIVAMMFIGEDITERRGLEEKLKESEERIKILARKIESEAGLHRLIGKSPAIRELKQVIASVAQTDVTVLLTGETGTGKELVASLIHEQSSRKHGPFIRINCGTLSESLLESELFGHEKGAFTGAINQKKGRLELAHRGTIFLDEIGEISPRMQVAILRFYETGEIQRVGSEKTLTVDVRIIAATNRNLNQAIAEGRFREDLFYRINVLPIKIPPLRERKEDILLLIEHFIREFEKKYGKKINTLAPESMRVLVDYPWPGNVRELENTIERLVVTAQKGTISSPDIEKALMPVRKNELAVLDEADLSLSSLVKQFERVVIEAVLKQEKGNSATAAAKLKISRSSLYGKLRKRRADFLL